MKVKRLRYEVVRPKSISHAISLWEQSYAWNKQFAANPHMSMTEAKGHCLEWLMEEVEVDLNVLNSEGKIGYWRDGVRYTEPLELAKVIIEDAQNSIAKGN